MASSSGPPYRARDFMTQLLFHQHTALFIVMVLSVFLGPAAAQCTMSGGTYACRNQSPKLTSVPANIPANTTILYLDTNQITSTTSDAFSGLTALTAIYLYSNQITSFATNAFAVLTQLQILSAFVCVCVTGYLCALNKASHHV
eukprot:m.161623 g.161623  ORF g.161623 m.161623 type:complete len:144 (-) comp15198_c2_seq4:889-1320(-)